MREPYCVSSHSVSIHVMVINGWKFSENTGYSTTAGTEGHTGQSTETRITQIIQYSGDPMLLHNSFATADADGRESAREQSCSRPRVRSVVCAIVELLSAGSASFLQDQVLRTD